METQIKTPVEIVQELIAIHTTRKEVVDKLKEKLSGDAADKLPAAALQSDQAISELMNELSNYGDAVMASVDRENEYEQTWKNAFQTLDTMVPEEGEQIFQVLEQSLKKIYQKILETETKLPDSLQEMLTRQAGQL